MEAHREAEGAEDDEDGEVGADVGQRGADALAVAPLDARARQHLDGHAARAARAALHHRPAGSRGRREQGWQRADPIGGKQLICLHSGMIDLSGHVWRLKGGQAAPGATKLDPCLFISWSQCKALVIARYCKSQAACCPSCTSWPYSRGSSPALSSEGELRGLRLAENVHMVVGHALLGYEHLLAAIDDKVASLQDATGHAVRPTASYLWHLMH